MIPKDCEAAIRMGLSAPPTLRARDRPENSVEISLSTKKFFIFRVQGAMFPGFLALIVCSLLALCIALFKETTNRLLLRRASHAQHHGQEDDIEGEVETYCATSTAHGTSNQATNGDLLEETWDRPCHSGVSYAEHDGQEDNILRDVGTWVPGSTAYTGLRRRRIA